MVRFGRIRIVPSYDGFAKPLYVPSGPIQIAGKKLSSKVFGVCSATVDNMNYKFCHLFDNFICASLLPLTLLSQNMAVLPTFYCKPKRFSCAQSALKTICRDNLPCCRRYCECLNFLTINFAHRSSSVLLFKFIPPCRSVLKAGGALYQNIFRPFAAAMEACNWKVGNSALFSEMIDYCAT